jgi:single-strand DNA-binding protein
MLRLSLIGNLAADAELRYSQKGNSVIAFRVGVNQTRTDAGGELQQSTEWFRVSVMGRQSEFARQLTKGTRVLIAGRLDISHYQSREGEQRVGYDVWADEIQNLSPRQLVGADSSNGSDTSMSDYVDDSRRAALPFSVGARRAHNCRIVAGRRTSARFVPWWKPRSSDTHSGASTQHLD